MGIKLENFYKLQGYFNWIFSLSVWYNLIFSLFSNFSYYTMIAFLNGSFTDASDIWT